MVDQSISVQNKVFSNREPVIEKRLEKNTLRGDKKNQVTQKNNSKCKGTSNEIDFANLDQKPPKESRRQKSKKGAAN